MAVSFRMSAVFGGIGRALAHPTYRDYWLGNSVSSVGRWMWRTALGWLTWELTHSPAWLGIVAFAEAAPLVAFTLFAGAIADRVGYFRIMRATQLAQGVLAALFAALVVSGLITIELVLLLVLAHGVLEAAGYPARMAAVHALVPRADLSPAIALGSTTFNGARIVGPAIAGPLILVIGVGGVIAVACASFFAFWFVLRAIKVHEAPHEGRVSRHVLADVGDGIRYMFRDRGILYLMFLAGATGLLIRPYIELLPAYAAQVFGRGPDGLAILLSSIGVGAMCAGIWVAQRGRTGGLTVIVAIGAIGMAGFVLAFTAVDSIWVAAIFLALSGACMLTNNVGAQTLLQNAVDHRMRARMLSLFVVISWGLPALGAVTMGWAATLVGIRPAVAGGSALAVVLGLWAWRVAPRLAPKLEAIPQAIPERTVAHGAERQRDAAQ
jgi:MFS family permease